MIRNWVPLFAPAREVVTRICVVVFLMSLAMPSGALRADDKPYVMKITLATVNDALHQFAKSYAAVIERDSGGRIKSEIYPESLLGSTQRQAEGVQFGAIQCLIAPPEFLTGIDERFELLAACSMTNRSARRARSDQPMSTRKSPLNSSARSSMKNSRAPSNSTGRLHVAPKPETPDHHGWRPRAHDDQSC
jgi:Bacterial extracellular solute-binding protein, family 7